MRSGGCADGRTEGAAPRFYAKSAAAQDGADDDHEDVQIRRKVLYAQELIRRDDYARGGNALVRGGGFSRDLVDRNIDSVPNKETAMATILFGLRNLFRSTAFSVLLVMRSFNEAIRRTREGHRYRTCGAIRAPSVRDGAPLRDGPGCS